MTQERNDNLNADSGVDDMPMRASVVIPAYNRATYLPGAFDALRRQTLAAFEVVVVDDGSTDNTIAVLEQYKADHPDFNLRWFEHGKNRGGNAARNTGIRHARAPFVPIIDSDCIPAEDWLEELVKVFEADPTVASVAGWVEAPAPKSIYDLVFKGELKVHGGVDAPRLPGPNMAFNRDIVRDNPLDEDLRYGCDEDGVFLRLRAKGYRQVRAPKAVVSHVHPYTSLAKFMAVGRSQGRSAAWLVYKYHLPTRLDMAPFLLGYGSLAVVLLLMAAGVATAFWLVVPAVFFAAACAALAYNELFRKRKTLWEAIICFPMLLIFYHNKVWGYVTNAIRLRVRANTYERIDLKALRSAAAKSAPVEDAAHG